MVEYRAEVDPGPGEIMASVGSVERPGGVMSGTLLLKSEIIEPRLLVDWLIE